MNEIAPELPPLRFDENKVIRIAGSRITLETLVGAFDRGETAEQIAQDYPTLSLGDVYRAIGYYLEHKVELDDYLSRSSSQNAEIRRAIEAKDDPTGIRARLLARKAKSL